MSSEMNQFWSGWNLILQDTMIDVSAVLAATESEAATEAKKCAAARPALVLLWAGRAPSGKANR